MSKSVRMLLLMLGGCGLYLPAQAATHAAASCSLANVQAALSASVAGDTVTVPAGNCTWVGSLSINKSVTVTGAGPSSTVIKDNNQAGTSPITVNLSGTQSAIITGFQFQRIIPSSPNYNAIISFQTSGRTFSRIYGNLFVDIDQRAIEADSAYLLIDSNTFTCVTAWCGAVMVAGDQSGTHPMDWGGPSFVFIENNIVDYSAATDAERDGAVDCKDKGRFVFRHNTVLGNRVMNHGFDSTISCMAFEIYNNGFTDNGPNFLNGYFVWLRGGTGLIHDNTMGGSESLYGAPILATNYRSCSGNAQISLSEACNGQTYGVCSQQSNGEWVSCTSGSQCGGGSCNKWCSVSRDIECSSDSNCPGGETCTGAMDGSGANGYSCRDQIGRGTNQQLYPTYVWSNTASGTIASQFGATPTLTIGDNGGGTCFTSQQIQANRDYCSHDPSAACGSVAAWTYTPYPYPHPMITGGGSGASSPCDVNADGAVNASDVQLEVNMTLGTASCTNPSGQCSVLEVQRVVNAALGGACVSP